MKIFEIVKKWIQRTILSFKPSRIEKINIEIETIRDEERQVLKKIEEERKKERLIKEQRMKLKHELSDKRIEYFQVVCPRYMDEEIRNKYLGHGLDIDLLETINFKCHGCILYNDEDPTTCHCHLGNLDNFVDWCTEEN